MRGCSFASMFPSAVWPELVKVTHNLHRFWKKPDRSTSSRPNAHYFFLEAGVFAAGFASAFAATFLGASALAPAFLGASAFAALAASSFTGFPAFGFADAFSTGPLAGSSATSLLFFLVAGLCLALCSRLLGFRLGPVIMSMVVPAIGTMNMPFLDSRSASSSARVALRSLIAARETGNRRPCLHKAGHAAALQPSAPAGCSERNSRDPCPDTVKRPA